MRLGPVSFLMFLGGYTCNYTSVLLNIHGRFELKSWISAKCVCVEPPQIHRLITIYIQIYIYIYNVMIFYICVMLFEIRQTLPICFSWVAYKFKCSRLRGHSYFLTSPCWLLLASCRSFVHHLLRMDRHRVSQ